MLDSPTASAELGERTAIADPPDQADSLARPLSLREARIRRPARVDMRWRNPCRLARRRLLGWKVRFNWCLLDRLGPEPTGEGPSKHSGPMDPIKARIYGREPQQTYEFAQVRRG